MTSPSPPEPAALSPAEEGLAVLEPLRQRIEAALAEIERLRAENAALAERVETLAAGNAFEAEPTPALALGGDPEALRAQVEHFIEAIDRMLAVPDTAGEDAPSESTG